MPFVRCSMFAFHFLLISVVLFQPGCNTQAIPVDLTPSQSANTVAVNFTRAYYAPSESGEDRIVLVEDPIDEPTHTAPGKPLPGLHSPPIWHVLLIDLHWRNAPPGNIDSPVARNADLHWYVFGKPTDNTTGVLHYAGQASVWLSPDKTGADISVDSGQLTLSDQHGDLRDPFKHFHISTRFHAIANPDRLTQVMDDVRTAITEADGGTAENSKNETSNDE